MTSAGVPPAAAARYRRQLELDVGRSGQGPEGDSGFQNLAGIDPEGFFHGILLVLKSAEKSGNGRPRGFSRTAHFGFDTGLGRQIDLGSFTEV